LTVGAQEGTPRAIEPDGASAESKMPNDREDPSVFQVLSQIDDRLGRLEGFSGPVQPKAYKLLTERGLDQNLARKLAEQLPAKAPLRKWQEELAALIKLKMPAVEPLSAPGRQMVVVVVGPTGSGKTTTIAKLAAHYHLQQHKSVLLISTDTFRVGAVEQLETFAGILKVPFRLARQSKEVKNLIEASDADVVLVDTQGHSVRHSLHMAEIRAVWEGTGRAEVLLTMPATLAAEEARQLVQEFLQGEPGRLVITKVDEATHPGPLLSALMTVELPLSFITNGQSVPEDIRVADTDRLVAWLLEGGVNSFD
jgi:flagellar biosynthesis protein FlhF